MDRQDRIVRGLTTAGGIADRGMDAANDQCVQLVSSHGITVLSHCAEITTNDYAVLSPNEETI